MKDLFLGIFEGGFDPAVGIVRDGKVLAFAEEERFLRNKHARGAYPFHALKFCLDRVNARPADIGSIGINWDIPSYTDGRMESFFQSLRSAWDVDDKTLRWQNSIVSYYSHDAVLQRHCSAWRRAFGGDHELRIYPLPHHYVHAIQAFLQSPLTTRYVSRWTVQAINIAPYCGHAAVMK